jgi:putative membrane protein
MNRLLATIGLAAALTLSASGGFAKDTPGQKFIGEAIEGNLAEVQMGQLAQEKGTRDDVKSYGRMLQQDHSAANQQATAAASAVGVTPPTEPNKKQKADHAKMAKLSGAAFDSAFAKHMVQDHKKDIAEYQKEAKRNDAQVSQYASATLPTLQKHLESAQSLAKGGR